MIGVTVRREQPWILGVLGKICGQERGRASAEAGAALLRSSPLERTAGALRDSLPRSQCPILSGQSSWGAVIESRGSRAISGVRHLDACLRHASSQRRSVMWFRMRCTPVSLPLAELAHKHRARQSSANSVSQSQISREEVLDSA